MATGKPSNEGGAGLHRLSGTNYERVRNVIRAEIYSGALPANARLKPMELAARYGVSPAPVREALQQLQGEGLIEMQPNRGARVRNVDERVVREVCEIRLALGSVLIRKAVKQMTPAALAEIRCRMLDFEAAVEAGDHRTIAVANRRYHDAQYDAGDNRTAAEILARNNSLLEITRTRIGWPKRRLAGMIVDHRELLSAMEAGDADAAVAIYVRHANSSRADLLAQMQKRTAELQPAHHVTDRDQRF